MTQHNSAPAPEELSALPTALLERLRPLPALPSVEESEDAAPARRRKTG